MAAKKRAAQRKAVVHTGTRANPISAFSGRNVRLGVLLLLIFILGISLTMTLYTLYMVEESKTIPYYFIVEDYVGIDANTTILAFGATRPGGTATRSFFISSEKDVRVFISASGEGADWITVGENGFLLTAGENKGMAFTVVVPEDAQKMRYEGRVNLLFLRPNSPFSPSKNLLAPRD